MNGERDEFALIAELFAPLATGFPGALGLKDDAALMDIPAGMQAVLTMDAIVAGVHFFADDPADLIARKLVRVNLSDLAAKGAKPTAIMMAAAFPAGVDAAWLRRFAAGLRRDVEDYGIFLIGGDTVSTPGPLTLSLTAFGQVPVGEALLRSGAQVGDMVWVSGTLGDAALGLKCRLGELDNLPATWQGALIERYLLPQPRTGLGFRLRGLANAAMDVSDGLVQDLEHLARQSGVAIELDLDALPLSQAAQAAVDADKSRLASVLGGGDDYEIVFTAPPACSERIRALGRETDIAVTTIGYVGAGQGVRVVDARGGVVVVPRTGWRHFDGSGGRS